MPINITLNAAEAFGELIAIARTIRQQSVETRDHTVNNATTSASLLVNYLLNMIGHRGRIAALNATPGLAKYARSQFDNEAYDIIAEYTGMVAKLEDVIDWIVGPSGIPKDANGYALIIKYTDSGQAVRTFTSAQLANFRTTLDSLIVLISVPS